MDTLRGTHLLEYWSILKRRRWAIYLAVATIGVAALVGSFLATPLYRATATVQIERQAPDVLSFKDLARTDMSYMAYNDFYQTQYKLLQSEAVARVTVRRLALTSHPDFLPESKGPSLYARLRALLPGALEPVPQDPEEIALRMVLGPLEISPVRNSHLVHVSWVSPDPQLAAQVANAVTDSYIQFNMQSQFSTTDQASEFLADQIGELRKEIAAHEGSLQSYGESKRIVSIDDSNNITIKALGEVAQERTAAQTALARAEASYRAVQASKPEALREVLESQLIDRLKAEHAELEVQYSEKARLFKDDWPEMRTLKSKMEQAQARIDLETASIASQVTAAAEADYRKALEEFRSLDSLQKDQEDAAQRLRRDAVEFASLQSEVQKKRETLNALMARQNEMAVSGRLKDLDTTSSNIRVIDAARVPAAPFSPNRKLNLAFGLVIGLTLGVGVAFLLDALDNTVRQPAEVERLLGLPTLAVIPRHGPATAPLARVRKRAAPSEPVDLVAHRDGRAGTAEAFRSLRTAMLLSNAGSPPRQILITSAVPEEGKSATAVNLAVVLAQLGRRVLLVDTDLRRPRLHKVFEQENRRGVSTYLSGLESDLRHLPLPSGVEGLSLIGSGPIPPNPSELLNSPLFAEMGKHFLDLGFDHVVYDAPPVLPVSDPVIVSRVVDAVILVVRAGRTPRHTVRGAAEKLAQAGATPVGVVLNDLDSVAHDYYAAQYYHRGDDGRDDDARVARKPSRTGTA